MKTSHKTKEQSSPKKKVRKFEAPEQENLAEQQIAEIWKEEVEGMIGKSYVNYEAAVEDLIKCILLRLKTEDSKQAELKKFLFDFMTSDPEFTSEIKSVLNIR